MRKERRTYKRFRIDGRAVLELENDRSRIINADLTGISMLGFSVNSPERIERGMYVKFELAVKSFDETFSGRGKIAYSTEIRKDGRRAVQIGIEFINIDNKKLPNFIQLIRHDIMEKPEHKQ